jgi:hypothetical protein
MTVVRVLRVRALRILFALALLSAQQAALAHGIWHLGDHSTQPAQKQLCDQHEALGTVAGAVDCPIAAAVGDVPPDFIRCFVALPAVATPGLAPSSRGPPTRS